MRVVLDTNVLVAGLLSPTGAPGRLLNAWTNGVFEMVTSPLQMADLSRVLAYPKIALRLPESLSGEFCDLVRAEAEYVPDSEVGVPFDVPDPSDEFLVRLCLAQRLPLVTGDAVLLSLAEHFPVITPSAFLDLVSHS